MPETIDAPHGRDANGEPLAPYGLTVEGKPRKSNRGARPGQRGNKPAAAKASPGAKASPTDARRVQMLCEMSSMLIETPLAAASQVPQLKARIGERQADALAGDAFVIAQFMPQVAEGLIYYSKSNPKALSWLDKIEESGPAVVVAAGLLQMGKALIQNHISPDPRLAQAGRNLVGLRMVQMAQAVNEQAAAYQAQQQEAAAYREEPDQAPRDPYAPGEEPTRVNDFAGV